MERERGKEHEQVSPPGRYQVAGGEGQIGNKKNRYVIISNGH